MKISEIGVLVTEGLILAVKLCAVPIFIVVFVMFLTQGVEHRAAGAIATLGIVLGVTAWEVYALRTRVSALEQRVSGLEKKLGGP